LDSFNKYLIIINHQKNCYIYSNSLNNYCFEDSLRLFTPLIFVPMDSGYDLSNIEAKHLIELLPFQTRASWQIRLGASSGQG
tara:strand:- start:1036 stop:1281 length:246 start_codon:yes stop_codon:yes gene_type:complete